jgi:hypothetical protein
MSVVTIRDLDPRVKAGLQRRAADHGRSMEAEARAILLRLSSLPAKGCSPPCTGRSLTSVGPSVSSRRGLRPTRRWSSARDHPDTNVGSELMRRGGDPRVLNWMRETSDGDLATTAITVAEIESGLARLPDGSRADALRTAESTDPVTCSSRPTS